MSRIRKGYERGFLSLLRQAGARRPEAGLRRLLERSDRLVQSNGVSQAEALMRVYERFAAAPYFRRKRVPAARAPLLFFCDSGLGGLARWLRASGYEAWWEAWIDDSELLRRARQLGAVVLTTDSMLLERRVVNDGTVATLWLPPILKIAAQLRIVFREFELSVGGPRCMACGGELVAGDKEALREQIPPRTYRWLDEYFVCRRCGKLFWHGTHWERIRKQLREAAAAANRGPC